MLCKNETITLLGIWCSTSFIYHSWPNPNLDRTQAYETWVRAQAPFPNPLFVPFLSEVCLQWMRNDGLITTMERALTLLFYHSRTMGSGRRETNGTWGWFILPTVYFPKTVADAAKKKERNIVSVTFFILGVNGTSIFYNWGQRGDECGNLKSEGSFLAIGGD